MIALIRGEVAIRRTDHVVMLCGGVGYRMAVSNETLRHVPPVGGETTLHTHLVVRDDALLLHGFHSEQERDLFLMLISVQAVGPKVALAVLSSGPPRELLGSIAAADSARFQAVPGIGKRTAERIIVELREKVTPGIDVDVDVESVGVGVGSPGSSPRALAQEGLLALGYSVLETDELLRDLEGDSPEELIAGALRTARRAA
jgi:holliday junction DNA helicase RuvA